MRHVELGHRGGRAKHGIWEQAWGWMASWGCLFAGWGMGDVRGIYLDRAGRVAIIVMDGGCASVMMNIHSFIHDARLPGWLVGMLRLVVCLSAAWAVKLAR